MASKRVVCLYRVSTKGQVDKNDIPMQRIECHKFIQEQNDWVLVHEYYEKGVSGFKKSALERDVLQQIKTDALKNQFDILLVFMFDRLGRREDETPFVVEWFSKQGIEIWSTQEGQQKFDNHTDKLINYIRFWQASGESEKTSIRVDTRHKQMAQEGLFRGGIAPYGYHIVPSGKFNKKKKELGKMVIDENEAKVIRQIYDYVYTYGFGNSIIAQKLNNDNIKSSSNGLWRAGVVGYILRNPVYKGYPAYKKSTRKNDISGHLPKSKWILPEKQQTDLIIIKKDLWNDVQKIREAKKTKNNNREPQHGKITKSPLLFVGIISCGYCGHPLSTNYNVKYNKDKTKKYRNAVYRCGTKALNKSLCKGQTTYSGNKIDTMILDVVYNHLKKIVLESPENKTTSCIDKKKELNSQIAKLQNEINKTIKEKELLLQEISNCLMGNSKFTQDSLSELISIKDNDLKTKQAQLRTIQEEIDNLHDEKKDNQELEQIVESWDTRFLKMDLNKQKMALRKLIKHITLYKNKIDIDFYESENDFIKIATT
jgi:DNA invertase Pin-like site-specific DNA recombinase